MTSRNIIIAIVLIALIGIAAFASMRSNEQVSVPQDLDPTPQNVTLSGTFECLPHLDTTGPQTEECAFGLKTDDGVYYAVNFGESANAMEQFQAKKHITAEGFVVIKEALSTDQWAKYNMKGIFTITKYIDQAPAASQKLNIEEVCMSALSYTSFPDATTTNRFLSDCREGRHPEVIERYKADMNLGDGATI